MFARQIWAKGVKSGKGLDQFNHESPETSWGVGSVATTRLLTADGEVRHIFMLMFDKPLSVIVLVQICVAQICATQIVINVTLNDFDRSKLQPSVKLLN